MLEQWKDFLLNPMNVSMTAFVALAVVSFCLLLIMARSVNGPIAAGCRELLGGWVCMMFWASLVATCSFVYLCYPSIAAGVKVFLWAFAVYAFVVAMMAILMMNTKKRSPKEA